MRAGEYLENRAWLVDDIAYIDVSTKTFPQAVALIDADDLESVLDGRGRWHAGQPGMRPGRTPSGPYVFRNIGPRASRELVSLHRVLMGSPPRRHVDHKNRDGLDNRRENLRIATGTQNSANRPGLGRQTPFKGVFPLPTGRFKANIRIHGVTSHIGHFDTADAAARAYDQEARRLFGEFAYLNFPEEVAA